ncbi:MJ0042-type zinc finger domain-containing protein, partial [Marinobacter alexandrii]
MTSSSLQTQCPKCETRFRVTSEQLGIAKGKVRCGNCLSVFNAIEHQVMPRSSSKPAPAQPEPETSEDYRTPEED